jgi:hypothetical protein
VLCAVLRVDEQPANDRNGIMLRVEGFLQDRSRVTPKRLPIRNSSGRIVGIPDKWICFDLPSAQSTISRLYVHLNPMPNLSKRIHGKIAKTQPDLGLYNLDRAPQIGYRSARDSAFTGAFEIGHGEFGAGYTAGSISHRSAARRRGDGRSISSRRYTSGQNRCDQNLPRAVQ